MIRYVLAVKQLKCHHVSNPKQMDHIDMFLFFGTANYQVE